MAYKPHYLNVEREVQNYCSGNKLYFSRVTTNYLGRKHKPPEKIENKSGRKFKRKDW